MKQRKALVVGLGIGGMAAALGLHKAGWKVVIAERASERRTGGYMVGLFPEGIAAAEALGVDDRIVKRTVRGAETLHVDEDGASKAGPGFGNLRGGPEMLLRGDIEVALWEAIEGRCDVRFSTTPTTVVNELDSTVSVRFRDVRSGVESSEHFDLVVGADGVRSTVRREVFGPDRRYLKSMNATICAFQLPEQLDGLDARQSLVAADPKRSLWVYALEGTAPTALLTYRVGRGGQSKRKTPKMQLKEVYDGMDAGGFVPAVIEQLEEAPAHLFDSVHQVRMRSWHRDRVVLLGDAAWCLTLYSGMGATAGLLGGQVLGEEMAANPHDIDAALDGYERRLRPFVSKHQRLAYPKSQIFVPSGRVTFELRRRFVERWMRKQREAVAAEAVAA